jgi:hypothetical protein
MCLAAIRNTDRVISVHDKDVVLDFSTDYSITAAHREVSQPLELEAIRKRRVSSDDG